MNSWAVEEAISDGVEKEVQTRLRSFLAALASVPLFLDLLDHSRSSPESTSLSQFPAERVLTHNDIVEIFCAKNLLRKRDFDG